MVSFKSGVNINNAGRFYHSPGRTTSGAYNFSNIATAANPFAIYRGSIIKFTHTYFTAFYHSGNTIVFNLPLDSYIGSSEFTENDPPQVTFQPNAHIMDGNYPTTPRYTARNDHFDTKEYINPNIPNLSYFYRNFGYVKIQGRQSDNGKHSMIVTSGDEWGGSSTYFTMRVAPDEVTITPFFVEEGHGLIEVTWNFPYRAEKITEARQIVSGTPLILTAQSFTVVVN